MTSVRRWWEATSALTRSVLMGVAGALIGIALVAVSVAVEHRIGQVVLSNLGTAIFTAAVIGMLYEAFVRDNLFEDMRKRIGVAENIVAQGLSTVGASESLPYLDLFRGCKELLLLPTDPVDWYTRWGPWLDTLAREQPVAIKVYLPKPETYSDVRRHIAGVEIDRSLNSAEHITNKLREAISSWARQSPSHVAASLEIFQYDSYPHRGVIASGECLVILTPSPEAPGHDPGALALVFEGSRAGKRLSEVKRSIASLPNVVRVDRAGQRSSTEDEANPIARVAPVNEEADSDPTAT